MTENVTREPLQIYIFSHPRTASNLFCKLFSQHPSVNLEKYMFLMAYSFGPEAQHQKISKEMDELNETYKNVAKDMTYQAALDKTQNLIVGTKNAGKFLILKDHAPLLTTSKEVQKMLNRPRKVASKPKIEDRMLDLSENERKQLSGSLYHNPGADPMNPTILPDRMMRTFTPVFFIRHPIIQIESYYRASRVWGTSPDEPDFELFSSYRFSKRLFNYYTELYRSGSGSQVIPTRWPVVIDGDDLVNDTEGIANRFCELTGIDSRGVIYKWEPEETTGPVAAAFLGTIAESNGVKRNEELKMPDIFKASIKWTKEWGPEVGKTLVQYVEDVMPDYEYLHQYRIKSEST